MMGLSNGLFMSPNRAAVMNSLPAEHRGAGSGMTCDLPELGSGAVDRDLLLAHDRRAVRGAADQPVPRSGAAGGVAASGHQTSPTCRPLSTLFAAFLGYNPMQHLLGPSVLAHLPPAEAAVLRGTLLLPAPHLESPSRTASTPPSTSPSGPAWWPRPPRGAGAVVTCTTRALRTRQPARRRPRTSWSTPPSAR